MKSGPSSSLDRLVRVGRTQVRAAAPPGGRNAVRYANADLLDSYAVDLPAGSTADVGRLAELALSDPPLLFRTLMATRDLIMSRFGVKTSGEVRKADDGLPRINFFPIIAKSDDEIELGFDDVHLDFRAWLTITSTSQARSLQSTTVARAHGLLGRGYLTVVRPFHVAIVRAGLRRAARHEQLATSNAFAKR